MKEINVIIDQEGNVEVEVNGAEGKSCLDATTQLEELLGEVEERKFKPEFRQVETKVKNQNRLRS